MKDKALALSLKILDEKKGGNILLLDLRKVTTFTDYFVIATGNSEIHCQALAREIVRQLKTALKRHPAHAPDGAGRAWMLLDYHDFIIHIFTSEAREFYNLEELWFEAKKSAYPAAAGKRTGKA